MYYLCERRIKMDSNEIYKELKKGILNEKIN